MMIKKTNTSPLYQATSRLTQCLPQCLPQCLTQCLPQCLAQRLTQRLPQLLLLALLLTACVSDEYVGGEDINGTPVSFSSSTGGGTRAIGGGTRAIGGNGTHVIGGGTRATGATAAALLDNTFTVFGSKKINGGEQPVFPGYVVNYATNTAGTTNSNTADWEYVGLTSGTGTQLIKYWDFSATEYHFAAYSLGQGDADGGKATITPVSSNALLDSYTISGTADQLASCYITNRQAVTPSATGQPQPVQLRFFTLSANIRIGLYETIPGYSVKDVRFYSSLSSDALLDTPTDTPTLFAHSKSMPDGGIYTVTFGDDGTVQYTHHGEDDQMKATIVTGTLTNFANKQIDEASAQVYLGRNSNESTITGYQSTLPNPSGSVLYLKVDYTLLSTDGSGQEIHVKGATAEVPAAYATWKSNYAYTYIFKISDNTNGYTGDPSDPDAAAGLYPITFDAWAAADGGETQGTITTIANYSITTTQEGDVNGNKVSYVKDKPIDITVIKGDGTAAEKIELGNASPNPNDYLLVYLQTSKNESDVEQGTTGKKEVTYYQGVGTFTPKLDGFYRVEYWHNDTPATSATAEKRAVKIVKVGNPDVEGGSIFAESEEWDNDYRHVKRK